MAILTKRVVQFNNGSCFWEYDYDDVQLLLVQLRCTNTSAFPTRGTLVVLSNGRTYSRLVAAGGTFDQAIPTNQQTRLDITIDPFGRVNGIDHRFEWGAGVV